MMRHLVALFISSMAGFAHADCAVDHVHLEGPWGKAQFSVDVADNPAAHARGLMFRAQMPVSAGMLFIWNDERLRNFWMKNTLIPLDIMFFDSEGILLNTAAQAQPGDLTALPSDGPAQYVLEINGGLAKRLGIQAGTQLGHASLKNSAAQAICLQ